MRFVPLVIRALLVLMLCALPLSAQTSKSQWFNGAVITNPTSSQILVSSGPLAPGHYLVNVYVYSDVGVSTRLEQMRGSVTVTTVVIPASDKFILFQGPLPLVLASADVLRVVSRGSVTAEVQAVLFVQPVT